MIQGLFPFSGGVWGGNSEMNYGYSSGLHSKRWCDIHRKTVYELLLKKRTIDLNKYFSQMKTAINGKRLKLVNRKGALLWLECVWPNRNCYNLAVFNKYCTFRLVCILHFADFFLKMLLKNFLKDDSSTTINMLFDIIFFYFFLFAVNKSIEHGQDSTLAKYSLLLYNRWSEHAFPF